MKALWAGLGINFPTLLSAASQLEHIFRYKNVAEGYKCLFLRPFNEIVRLRIPQQKGKVEDAGQGLENGIVCFKFFNRAELEV